MGLGGSLGVGEGFVGDLFGAGDVALDDLHLGEVQAGQLGWGAAQDVVAAFGEEGDLLVFVALAVDVHAVDHLAHVLFEADAVPSIWPI